MTIPIDKPNKQVTGRPEATVFIARLNHITNEGIALFHNCLITFIVQIHYAKLSPSMER